MAALTLTARMDANDTRLDRLEAGLDRLTTAVMALVDAQTPAAVVTPSVVTPSAPVVTPSTPAVRVTVKHNVPRSVQGATAQEIGTKAWNKAVFALLGGKSEDWTEITRLRNAGATVREAAQIHKTR